jgi:hypothetical protein
VRDRVLRCSDPKLAWVGRERPSRWEPRSPDTPRVEGSGRALHIPPWCHLAQVSHRRAHGFGQAGRWGTPGGWLGAARLHRGMSLAQTPPGLPLPRRLPGGRACRGQPAGSTLPGKVREAECCCPRERRVTGPRLGHMPSEPVGTRPTAAATATRVNRGGLRRAVAPVVPRSETLTNGAELRKQSLKTGGPTSLRDGRALKPVLRCSGGCSGRLRARWGGGFGSPSQLRF